MPKSLIFNQCILHDEFVNLKVDNQIYKTLLKEEKNNFNHPHVHPRSNFSGIYYLKVPKKGGELIFLENDKRSMSDLFSFIDSEEFYSEYYIYPKKGLFLLFPSSLSHMVKPHIENTDRISVAFNITLV